MKFQPGQPRPANAGRKKGTRNKKTVARVDELLAEHGKDPVAEILELLELVDDKGVHVIRPFDRMQAWFDLLPYCQSKLAPTPPEEDDDSNIDDEDLLDQMKDVSDEALIEAAKIEAKQIEAP